MHTHPVWQDNTGRTQFTFGGARIFRHWSRSLG
jgi:hypothetical protein